MQSKQKFLVPAIAAAIALGGIVSVQAQSQSQEGSSSPAEVQRGVPGVDVDVNANKGGLPNLDVQAGNKNDSDNGILKPDTSAAGAGPEKQSADGMRKPIQDRN